MPGWPRAPWKSPKPSLRTLRQQGGWVGLSTVVDFEKERRQVSSRILSKQSGRALVRAGASNSSKRTVAALECDYAIAKKLNSRNNGSHLPPQTGPAVGNQLRFVFRVATANSNTEVAINILPLPVRDNFSSDSRILDPGVFQCLSKSKNITLLSNTRAIPQWVFSLGKIQQSSRNCIGT